MAWPDSPTLIEDIRKQRVGGSLHFTYLPGYAKYLLENKIAELSALQLNLVRSLKVPLFKYFSALPEQELLKTGEESLRRMLSYLADNNAKECIDDSVRSWLSNQLPVISKDQVVPEDITLISLVRRQIFREQLLTYTDDVRVFSKIMDEIDLFLSEADTISFKMLFLLQQNLYQQTQALANIGHWEWDLVQNKLTWSDEVFRIYELELQTEVPQDLARFNHPDDAKNVLEAMKRSRETLQPHDFFYRIILNDGRQKFLHARGQVQVDERGFAKKMFGTLQDLTKQQQIQHELQEKQTFIEKINNLTPSLIVVYDIRTGQCFFVSEAIHGIFGYASEVVLQRGIEFFREIIPPDDLEDIIVKGKAALQAANHAKPGSEFDGIIEFKYRLRHANGTYRWIQTYCTVFSRDKNNMVETVVNVSVDVTSQVQAAEELAKKNEALKQSEERYHRMIDQIEDYAILLLDQNGIVQNWNKGAEKIKGYRSDEIVGRSFRVFYTPEDRANGVPEQTLESARSRGKAALEGWRMRKDGTLFWGNIVVTSMHDEENNVIGFTKVTRDLTERKRAEDTLREHAIYVQQKNDELEQKNKELESFSYIASHDLQEPLRKIIIFSRRIEEQGDLSPGSKEFFERIIAAASRMQLLIDALLNFASISRFDDQFESTNLGEMVDELCRDLADASHGADIHFEISNLPVINVIRVQFQQLLTNIIGNAVKYRRPGIPLQIKVSCAIVDADQVQFSAPYGKFYKISISDNGIGFEQQYATKIFEPFQRLHGRKEYAGAGIGLSICKKIVANHDGIIEAESELRKGSTFHIYLPMVSVPELQST